MKSTDRGRIGEEAATRYLRRHGYEIIDRNYHSRFGEVDIIAKRDGIIAFCEVKTRKNDDFAKAREFVDAKKQHKIILTASAYISEKRIEIQPRFDVIEVYYGRIFKFFSKSCINHIENAFTL